MADQISDAILDHCLTALPTSRVACETLVTTDTVVVAGEITTKEGALTAQTVDAIARKVIREIGYDDPVMLFSADEVKVFNFVHAQSPDIAMGVDTGGAGDQGLMFGYACDETAALMPLPIQLAHRLVAAHADLRAGKLLPWLRPDAKSQVTVIYDEAGRPCGIDTIVLSTQHDESVMEMRDGKQYFSDAARELLIDTIIRPVLNEQCPELATGELIALTPDALDAQVPEGAVRCFVNPTGNFLIGGPHGDTGLTGRKIIVDTYGGYARHGGGAFSGKDATKVDRSAAYMARYLAKLVVAAKLANKCEIQLAYAIGVAEPVSVRVDTFGTGAIADQLIAQRLRANFDLTPKGIMQELKLTRPVFAATAKNGHFGNAAFSWEDVSRAGLIG